LNLPPNFIVQNPQARLVFQLGLLFLRFSGQHQTALHHPDLHWRMNGKPRLCQPLTLNIDPRHRAIGGGIKMRVVFVLKKYRAKSLLMVNR